MYMFMMRNRFRIMVIRYRFRRLVWKLRLKFAIAVFKLKRWRAFRRVTPIVYKTRGKRPGSIIVMHCKHRKYDFTVYRVTNWFGTLRKVYP